MLTLKKHRLLLVGHLICKQLRRKTSLSLHTPAMPTSHRHHEDGQIVTHQCLIDHDLSLPGCDCITIIKMAKLHFAKLVVMQI